MNKLTIDALDLMTFFECEPSSLENNELWECNDSVYKYKDKNFSLNFAIAPFHKDIRVILEINGSIAFEFNAMGITDIAYHKDESLNESLEILITNDVTLSITLKPSIKIIQNYKK